MPDRPRRDRSTQALEAVAAHLGPVSRGLLIAITTVLVGWALHAMAAVAIPVVLALLIAFIVAPVDRSIAGRLPRGLKWIGHLAVMAILVVVLAAFTVGLVYCADQLLSRLPEPERMERMVSERLMDTGGAGTDASPGTEDADPAEGTREAGSSAPSVTDLVMPSGDALGRWLAETAATLLRGVAGATGTLVSAILLIVFLVLLMLAERPTWDAKIVRLWSDGADDVRATVATTASKLRRWLLVRSLIGVVSALAYAAWLWIFGVDMLGVWALLTFLLVFVPNIGAVISGTLPTIYAFATQDIGTALWVGAGLFVIENVIGNWIDPRLQGQQIALSPVVIFVALLLWSWIWGVAGAFLSTPLTIVAMVICAHVAPLRPVALLLSDKSDLKALDETLRT